ncbi:hypothetical protein T484DRAFT_1779590 [Baffinella frigidus]|nr:hypothetical protein T484DRAFT_1779590 [Cryptophyta sp. CCMP2293]
MCAAPAPTPAATDAATDAAAQPGAAALHSALSDAAAPKIGAGSIAALLSAVERVTCQKGEPARAAEGGDGGDAFLQKVPLPRTEEVHFASSGPGTPGASSSEAQQDKAGGSASAASDDDGDNPATKLNASGFVDNVIPRRRGNEKKVVLTRALLESYHHESLDTVTERLGLSKTTIKAACRKLGLPK